jgi:hypothetical protein
MTNNGARVAAISFFQSYTAAFEHADASAILDHFAFPCHITSEAQEVTLTAIASREEGSRLVGQLLDMYRNVDVATARVLEVGVSEISPRLLLALVHWGLDDEAGARVYAFEAAYTLASIDGVLRISAIAHNEIPRYRATLARISS